MKRERERERDFKLLAYFVVEAGKFKIHREDWETGDPKKT